MLPIFAAQDFWGILAFDIPGLNYRWDTEDTDLLRAAAKSLGAAIELRERAVRDPLTGLFNRRFLDELLEHELARARRDQTPLSVVMVDIDHFKDVNDVYGHAVGDEVLSVVSAQLLENSRRADTVARVGGDEFVLVLPNSTLEVAVECAERLRMSVREATGASPNLAEAVTVSAGVASLIDWEDVDDDLVAAADRAMLAAKRAGRDRVVVRRYEGTDSA